jgi:hypothetical protein
MIKKAPLPKTVESRQGGCILPLNTNRLGPSRVMSNPVSRPFSRVRLLSVQPLRIGIAEFA